MIEPLALSDQAAPVCEVIELRPRLLPRHEAQLRRWVDAGRRMGLLDAQISYAPTKDAPYPNGFALVWVREASDPAYLVAPEGRRWIVVDAIRECQLTACSTFDAALDFIRPALDQTGAA